MGNYQYCNYGEYYDKLYRLIEIVEYKLGLITQDEMDSDLFNEQNEKNDWVMHTFTHNYKRDEYSYHYYRKCSKCGYKWYSLHSRYEIKNTKCQDCK